MNPNDFLKVHTDSLDVLGFWAEEYESSVIRAIEMQYKPEVLIHWHITDIVPNGDKFLTKWHKRHRPLTAEEFEKRYGIKLEGGRADGN